MHASIAWISPVKCKSISSFGTILALPAPVAPPFVPKTGPKDGSRSATILFLPSIHSASFKPIDMVVLPSPYLVGFIDVTSISLPFELW